jgi:hypothetical protein
MLRMDRFHPNQRWIALAARGLFVLLVAGCSNQQMSASNPFMSPDRVPPPATRTIAPGTAAPYYPGDPIPAAQVAPPAAPLVAQAPPGFVPQGSPPVAAMAASNVAPAAAPPTGFTNERTVAIPADNADLRFAVPPQTVPPGPAQNSAPQIAAAAAPAVVPAAYNQAVPSATEDIDTNSPWRSPAVPNATSPVMQAQYSQPQQLQPAQSFQSPASSGQQMPVQLRAVPAPPTTQALTAPQPATMVPVAMAPVETATTPPPRMRFPSMTDPTTWFTPQPAVAAPQPGPQPGQQLVGYMVPGPNGAMQMVSVEQMQAMYGGAAQPTAEVASSDGFRARGSATK